MADKRKTSFLVGFLFVSIGAAMMAGSFLLHRSDAAFFSAATQTTAIVTDKHTVSRAHKRDRMSLRYTFELDGQIVEGAESWNGDTNAFREMSEGDEITVAYIAKDETSEIRSRLITGGRQGFMTSILLIGGVFAAAGVLLLLKSRRRG